MTSLRCFNRALEGRISLTNTRPITNFTTSSSSKLAQTSSTAAGVGVMLPGRLLRSYRGKLGHVPLPISHSGADRSLLDFAASLRSGMYGERCLHTSNCSMGKKRWETNNKKVFPPQKPGEPPRMAEVYYCRRQIKHSMRKMWYIATFVKGMMIDDALTQLQFIKKKSAGIAREVLLEAQEEAVKNHNVEFKSNLHIAKSFVGKGDYDNAMRIHAKGRFSIMDLVYCHYHVCLKEGPPPKEIEATGYDQAQHYMDSLRKRTIQHSI